MNKKYNYKLSLLEKSVLKSIRRAEGSACPTDLSRATGLSNKDVSIALDELNKKGEINTMSRCFHQI